MTALGVLHFFGWSSFTWTASPRVEALTMLLHHVSYVRCSSKAHRGKKWIILLEDRFGNTDTAFRFGVCLWVVWTWSCMLHWNHTPSWIYGIVPGICGPFRFIGSILSFWLFYLRSGKKTAIISHFETWGVKKIDRWKLSNSFSSNKALSESFGRIENAIDF